MKNIDKIITALYHAKSDNREKILSDLVLTVMYSAGEYLSCEQIVKNIRDFFHLEPIKYEIEQCLNLLSENNKIQTIGNTYALNDETQSYIHLSLVKVRDSVEKRAEAFTRIISQMFKDELENDEVDILWNVYNEYLLECFMAFGRKAINFFMPFQKDELPHNNDIIEQAYKSLNTSKLKNAFEKLIIEYPEKLSEAELRHLNSLAIRAEKIYSLGIEGKEYDKISNLQIRNLVVLADTNILYTILNLHVHQEKSAITEIIRLAKEKIIDFKIVYLPKTYRELQKAKAPLENLISREKFKIGHIKAMLASGNLDELAKNYYENKLHNMEYPHPADNIVYAKDILEQYGITLYNQKFLNLEDNPEYFNKKVQEYYDYQNYYNNLCAQKGIEMRLNKDDYKIEHDIFLREAVKTLKDKFSKDILKFLSLTIDRSLVQFDQYTIGKENIGQHYVINPNFMIPSVFIKQIRPFIPIVTNNYRKAFIASLIAPSFHRENDEIHEKTILTQKSLTYFKNLGIEDEDVICNIIKRELFLEEFSKHEQNQTSEEFIKSEISKEIELIKTQTSSLTAQIVTQKETAEKILNQEKLEKEKIITQKEMSEKSSELEIEKLIVKIKEKESLEDQLRKLNVEQAKFTLEGTLELKRELLDEVNQSILNLENSRKPLDDIVETAFKNYAFKWALVPISYFFIMCFLIYKYSWNTMEQFAYLTSLFGVCCGYVYFAISGKSFNPLNHFVNHKNIIASEVHTKFNFNLDYLNSQIQKRVELENEISNLLDKITHESMIE